MRDFCFADATFNFRLVVDKGSPRALLVHRIVGVCSFELESGAIAGRMVATKRDLSLVVRPFADPVVLASFRIEQICSQW
jgi:hypothetical protein